MVTEVKRSACLGVHRDDHRVVNRGDLRPASLRSDCEFEIPCSTTVSLWRPGHAHDYFSSDDIIAARWKRHDCADGGLLEAVNGLVGQSSKATHRGVNTSRALDHPQSQPLPPLRGMSP